MSAPTILTWPAELGCPHGCPLDHHDEDCIQPRRLIPDQRRCPRPCQAYGAAQLADAWACPCPDWRGQL